MIATTKFQLQTVAQTTAEDRQTLDHLISGSFNNKSRLDEFTWVAYCKANSGGGPIIGAVGLYWIQEGYLCLNQLCVAKAFRRHGIGSWLLGRVVAACPGAKMALYVDKGRPNTDWLVEFYQRHGFTQVETGSGGVKYDSAVEFLLVRKP